ncbi:MAG: PPC domain-containing protein [Cyanobacteria bacterium P01_G01_bin.54]
MSSVREKQLLLMGALVCTALSLGVATPSLAQSCRAKQPGDVESINGQKQHCLRPTITSGQDQRDTLTDNDIPNGEGGFFRDYEVELREGDNVAIDLVSNEFDPIVALIKPDGTPMGNNDDSPEGTTNSLLFLRIKETGAYIVRVSSFGETGGGTFTLTVTRLAPVD